MSLRPDSPAAFPRALLRIVVTVWITLLIVGSLQPARPGIVTGHHRLLHWVAFAGAALLLISLSETRHQEILRAIIVFFMGVSLEVLQHLIYRNPLEWRDIGDDGVAILAAFALCLTVSRRTYAHDTSEQLPE